MAKMGRPKREFNINTIDSLVSIQCTQVEVCNVLETTEKTLNVWLKENHGVTFSQYFDQKRDKGRASLRRKQWALADKNATMGIWLGKQYLDQHDKQEIEHSGNMVNIINDIK